MQHLSYGINFTTLSELQMSHTALLLFILMLESSPVVNLSHGVFHSWLKATFLQAFCSLVSFSLSS